MTALAVRVLEYDTYVTEHFFYTHYVLKFDPDVGRFVPEWSHKKLKWFYFGWNFLTLFLWSLCTLYVMIWQGVFYPDTVTSDRLFFTLVLSAPLILTNGLNYGLAANRDGICNYHNAILALREKYLVRKTSADVKKKTLRELLTLEWQKLTDTSQAQGEVDYVGLFMVSAVFYFTLIPILYIPAPFLLNIDPFTYPMHVITGFDKLPLWLYIPLRCIPAVGANVCCMEAGRAIRSVFLHIIFASKTTASLLQRIETISERDISTAMEQYSLTYACHVKSVRSASLLLFYAVEGGMFIAIITLTGTFVGWKLLSPLVYWMNPLMAVLSIVIIAIAMPCAAYTVDMSLGLLNDWHFRINECKRGSRKLNRRILKSLQPVAFYMSAMGYLMGDTKTSMFETIIMNTVDTVLMVNDFIS